MKYLKERVRKNVTARDDESALKLYYTDKDLEEFFKAEAKTDTTPDVVIDLINTTWHEDRKCSRCPFTECGRCTLDSRRIKDNDPIVWPYRLNTCIQEESMREKISILVRGIRHLTDTCKNYNPSKMLECSKCTLRDFKKHHIYLCSGK